MNIATFRLWCASAGLATILAACGGGSDHAGAPTGSASTGAGASTPSLPVTTPAATGGPSAASASSESATSGESTADAGSAAGGGATHPLKPFRVTYAVTGSMLSSVTLSTDGKRSAMITPGGKIISVKDGTIACSSSSKKCVRFPDGSSQSGSSVKTNDLARIEADGTPVDARLVAGVNTDCYRADATRISEAYTGKATVCIDPRSGAPLSWKAKSATGKTVTYTATEVGTPKDGDFKPDWPVTDQSTP